jgi:probable rRNA maturation factor
MELVLVPDGAMEELNRKHLHLPGPTNILSFPAGKDFPGSLVLAPETMRRECFLYGQNPQEHVLRLLAHGLAHLLGREHGPEMDRLTALMEKAGRIAAGGLSTVAECRYAPLGGADEYFQGQSAPLAPSGGGGNP